MLKGKGFLPVEFACFCEAEKKTDKAAFFRSEKTSNMLLAVEKEGAEFFSNESGQTFQLNR